MIIICQLLSLSRLFRIQLYRSTCMLHLSHFITSIGQVYTKIYISVHCTVPRSQIVQCAICDISWGLFVVINWNTYNTCTHTRTLASDSVLVYFFSLFGQISDSYNIVAEWIEATKTHYRLPSSRDYFESICSFLRYAALCCAPRVYGIFRMQMICTIYTCCIGYF